jgi:hypothetical protein
VTFDESRDGSQQFCDKVLHAHVKIRRLFWEKARSGADLLGRCANTRRIGQSWLGENISILGQLITAMPI